jgi:hypothetical protein
MATATFEIPLVRRIGQAHFQHKVRRANEAGDVEWVINFPAVTGPAPLILYRVSVHAQGVAGTLSNVNEYGMVIGSLNASGEVVDIIVSLPWLKERHNGVASTTSPGLYLPIMRDDTVRIHFEDVDTGGDTVDYDLTMSCYSLGA